MNRVFTALGYIISGCVVASLTICALVYFTREPQEAGRGFDATGIYVLVFGLPVGALLGLIAYSLVSWVRSPRLKN